MKIIQKRKSLGVVALTLAIVFLLAQVLLYVPAWVQTGIKSYASASELTEYTEQVTVTNGTFASTSGSSSIRTPSSWTAIGTDSAKELVKAGVIDTSNTSFEKNKDDLGLTINPETKIDANDDYILMINAEENATSYGYKSSTITLDAQSYYAISFSVLTKANNNNGFSAYLTGDGIENSPLNSFVNVQSNVWNTYTIFVKTGLSSVDANLELWLGTSGQTQNTSGAVFFDTVQATKYTQIAYDTVTKGTYSSKEIDLQQKNLNKIANGSFEQDLTDWTRTSTSSNSVSGLTSLSANGFNIDETKIDKAPSTNMLKALDNTGASVRNQKGLFINNLAETAVTYKSKQFTVDRFEMLAVSVWVKTGNLSDNGASIKLIEVVEDGETATYSSEFTGINTSSYTNTFTNNWAQYTFYVKGNPFKSVELQLELSLGTSEGETRGYAFFDEIRTTALTVSQYTNATTGTYLKTLSLASLDALDIANGAFNLTTDGEKVDGVFAPSDWTLSSESGIDSKYSGIINTKSEYFDAYKTNYGSIQNPGIIASDYNGLDVSAISNNILMIYNPISGDQTFKSSDYSVPGDGTYKITFYAKLSQLTKSAEVKIVNDSTTIGKLTIKGTEWTQYTVYVKTGSSASNVAFALSLGSNDAPQTGHAFFDNFISTSVEDDIYAISKNSTTIVCDLADENFLITGDTVNGVATPYRYTGKNNVASDSSIVAGIISASNNTLGLDLVNDDAKSDNRLVIYSPNDTYYTFTSNKSYTFNASSYYTVSVTLKVLNINQDEENKQLDDDKNAIPYGVFVELAGLNAKSNAITKTENYITYTFYVKTADSETTSTIAISLGSTNALTRGAVAVSNITVSDYTEDEYKESVGKLDNAIASKVDLSDGSSSTSDDEKDKTESRPQLELVDIAGILICLALVIAIVGTIIRQVADKRRKNKSVKVTNAYDRASKKVVKSEARIEERLAEVEAELSRLNETITILTKAQNELLARREVCQDGVESEKLLRKIEKISNELEYELDNKDSVEKERAILKDMIK